MEDQRPTITSTDGWGIWSSLEGHTLEENTWEDIRIEGPRRHIWSSHNVSDQLMPFQLKNVLAYGNTEWDGPLWAARLYNVKDARISDCEFARIGNFNGTYQFEGHALYFNLLGDCLIQDTFFHDLLGQALQLVWRESETLLTEQPEGTVYLRRIRIRDAAMHADRGSYPISVFDTGHDIQLHRTSVWTTRRTPEWYNSRTGLTQRSRGGVFCAGGHRGAFIAKKLNVRLMDADRASVKLERLVSVDWDRGYVEDIGSNNKRARIEINDVPTGSIRNLTGNYEIVRDRATVAVNEDYSW